MVEVEVLVIDPAYKSLVAKTCCPLLPSLGVSEIQRRVGTGEALICAAPFHSDHDDISRTLIAVCDRLAASGVPFRISERLSNVSLADESLRHITKEINLDVLKNMLSNFEKIRREEREVAELEGR